MSKLKSAPKRWQRVFSTYRIREQDLSGKYKDCSLFCYTGETKKQAEYYFTREIALLRRDIREGYRSYFATKYLKRGVAKFQLVQVRNTRTSTKTVIDDSTYQILERYHKSEKVLKSWTVKFTMPAKKAR